MILPPPRSTLFPYTTLFRSLAQGQLFKKVLMLRINLLLESGDAPQKFFDRHIPKIRHAVSGPENGKIGKSTRLNSSHGYISYAVFCLKKKKNKKKKQKKKKK